MRVSHDGRSSRTRTLFRPVVSWHAWCGPFTASRVRPADGINSYRLTTEWHTIFSVVKREHSCLGRSNVISIGVFITYTWNYFFLLYAMSRILTPTNTNYNRKKSEIGGISRAVFRLYYRRSNRKPRCPKQNIVCWLHHSFDRRAGKNI